MEGVWVGSLSGCNSFEQMTAWILHSFSLIDVPALSCLWEQFLNWLPINRVCSRTFLEHHKNLKQAVFKRVP